MSRRDTPVLAGALISLPLPACLPTPPLARRVLGYEALEFLAVHGGHCAADASRIGGRECAVRALERAVVGGLVRSGGHEALGVLLLFAVLAVFRGGGFGLGGFSVCDVERDGFCLEAAEDAQGLHGGTLLGGLL